MINASTAKELSKTNVIIKLDEEIKKAASQGNYSVNVWLESESYFERKEFIISTLKERGYRVSNVIFDDDRSMHLYHC